VLVQPVRCDSTDSSAHKVTRGSLIAARWAARTCRSVHGDCDLTSALEAFQAIGDRRWIARTHLSTAGLARLRHDWRAGQQHLDLALAPFRTIGDQPTEARTLRECRRRVRPSWPAARAVPAGARADQPDQVRALLRFVGTPEVARAVEVRIGAMRRLVLDYAAEHQLAEADTGSPAPSPAASSSPLAAGPGEDRKGRDVRRPREEALATSC
jgi:hypothetical protein